MGRLDGAGIMCLKSGDGGAVEGWSHICHALVWAADSCTNATHMFLKAAVVVGRSASAAVEPGGGALHPELGANQRLEHLQTRARKVRSPCVCEGCGFSQEVLVAAPPALRPPPLCFPPSLRLGNQNGPAAVS